MRLMRRDALVPRADFPLLDRVTYLNTASIAVTSRVVRAAVQRFEEEVGGGGTVTFNDDVETFAYEDTRRAAAELVGARPEDIGITGSATEALNQVAWWLRPGAGSNVVSIDIEFPSVTYPWLRIAEETGVEVRLARAKDRPEALAIDDVLALIDDRTAAVCVSHVQYATGFLIDLSRLAEAAHAHDALLIVDATQSAGMVPIDVRADDVDVLMAGSYKWLCGAFGAALCYLRPDIAERFRPPFVGWRSRVDAFVFDADSMPIAPGARGMEYSTVAYGSGIALGAAIRYLLDVGVDRIFEHDRTLAASLLAGATALGGRAMAPRDADARTGIVSVRFDGWDAKDLWARLDAAKVYTSARLGAVRFSPHLYNDASDVQAALDALGAIVERGPA
jgi:selenocysteine lyase/cysteine desulfurase